MPKQKKKITSKPVTLDDIARECGITKGTASRALRGERRFASEELIQRVRVAAADLGYDPTRFHAARRLASIRFGQHVPNRLVALLLPDIFYEHSYFLAIFRGILEVLMHESYTLATCTAYRGQEGLPPVFARGEVDGVILLQNAHRMNEDIACLRQTPGFNERPVVLLFEATTDVSCVVTDDEAGGYETVRYLLELGHRHIVHFWEPSHLHPVTTRRKGYTRAMREFGIDPDIYLHYVQFEDYEDDLFTGKELLIDILREHPEYTAILSRNDLFAQQIHALLTRHGFRVPEDISLVGHDDSDAILNDHGDNILTTVHLPLVDVGRTSARLLLQQIHDQATEKTTVTLPATLVIRSTTAPPAPERLLAGLAGASAHGRGQASSSSI